MRRGAENGLKTRIDALFFTSSDDFMRLCA